MVRRTLPLVVALLAALPASAQARDAVVRSFDGTPIVTNFFPADGLKEGERAPTVLVGHGWGVPAETNPEGGSLGPLHRAGYNVVTWEARGFHGSGATVQVDSPDFEGRDVKAIIDFVAEQPEAQLDAPGDPRVGMSGPSYGGAIQLVTAAIDQRVDAITPTIAWNSLENALFRNDAVLAGWALALAGVGGVTSTVPGVISPAGIQTGHLPPEIYESLVTGLASGYVASGLQRWFATRGATTVLDRIKAPTLIFQGTVDTIFPLDEGHANFQALRDNGMPVKMVWFCGGHGACLTEGDEGIDGGGDRNTERVLDWFTRYLKGDRSQDTGPAFEWVDEEGKWHANDRYPERQVGAARGHGQGTLALTPGATGSGVLIYATPSLQALEVPIATPPEGSHVLGSPTLKLRYRATGATVLPERRAFAYAQLIDEARGIVVNNQATPIPLIMDGAEHELEIDLVRIASRSTSDGYTLQLIPQTSLYDVQRASGTIDFSSIDVALPLTEPVVEPELALTRRCVGGRLRVRLQGETEFVRDVNFKLGKRLVRRDARAPFQQAIPARSLRRARGDRLRAVVYLKGAAAEPRVVLARTLPRCGTRR